MDLGVITDVRPPPCPPRQKVIKSLTRTEAVVLALMVGGGRGAAEGNGKAAGEV